MKEGWLNFEEKPMQMDTDLFQVQANYVELVQILMVGASIGMSKVETPLSEDEVNQALEEFEKEEEFLFPPAGDTLLEFLTKKQKAEKEVMFFPRCSVVFGKSATKAFEASEIRKNYQKIQVHAKGKEKKNISMIVKKPYNVSQKRPTYV